MVKNEFQSDLCEALREVMRNWASGVAVITSAIGGSMHGMTVNSLHSVSLDPPMVIVTLAKNTRTHEMVSASGIFGVSILSDSQQWLSERFAGRVGSEDNRFFGVPIFYLKTGVPLIKESIAWLECTVIQQTDLPHSTMFLGEVSHSKCCGTTSPLVYLDRKYHSIKG